MVIILTAFLAAAQSLPIDRTALELQSRAEALQPRGRTPRPPAPSRPARASRSPQPARTTAVRPGPSRPAQTVSAPATTALQRRTQPRRANSGGPLDLASITTICRAAGNQDDPAGFIARLATAYSLSDARQHLAPGELRRLSRRPRRRAPRLRRDLLIRNRYCSSLSIKPSVLTSL